MATDADNAHVPVPLVDLDEAERSVVHSTSWHAGRSPTCDAGRGWRRYYRHVISVLTGHETVVGVEVSLTKAHAQPVRHQCCERVCEGGAFEAISLRAAGRIGPSMSNSNHRDIALLRK